MDEKKKNIKKNKKMNNKEMTKAKPRWRLTLVWVIIS